MSKHRDGQGTPITVGATVKMDKTADSGFGATGRVLSLSYTANMGDPVAVVLWDDRVRDVYLSTKLRVITPEGTCPGCGRHFTGSRGLTSHRTARHAAMGCRLPR